MLNDAAGVSTFMLQRMRMRLYEQKRELFNVGNMDMCRGKKAL